MGDTDATQPFTGSGSGEDGATTLPAGSRFTLLSTLGAGGMGVVIAAHDPQLNRKVALKLLRPDLLREDREHWTERLTREAQAMAQLAHPNVVTVYETVDLGERLAIVMELVDGGNLRKWMLGKTDWREILTMLCAAGRGLAAAHAVGLVHRDFKPDNVLIGSDGRARVTDFGLVTTGLRIDSAEIGSGSVASALSITGNIVGTPAYMAPEQWDGGDVDARTDQFAFCVTAWEAVFGERPFRAASAREQRTSVTAVVPEPPAGKAPRWVEVALRRGLSRDPAARWPSMNALLDVLDPARRRRRPIVAAAALLGAGAVAATVTWMLTSSGAACPDPHKQLAGVWDPAVKQALSTRFAGLGPAFAADEWKLAATRLDGYTTAWTAMHVASCKATRLDHTESELVMDLRTRCLDRRLAALRGLTTLLATASVDLAVKVPTMIDSLPSVDDCGDVERLTAYPLPAGAAARTAIDEVEAERDHARLERQSGDIAGAIKRIDAAVARARQIGYPPLLLGTLLQAAPYHSTGGDAAAGVPLLREAIQVAATARDDHGAAQAWSMLVNELASEPETVGEAKTIEQAAVAATVRAGSPPDMMVEFLGARATVAFRDRRPADAVALLEQAIALHGINETDRSEAITNLAKILFMTGHPRDALPYAQQSLELSKAIFGPEHPWTADALTLIAQLDGALGDTAAAEQAGTTALGIQRAAYGADSEPVVETLQTLANNAARRNDRARADELIAQAIAIEDKLGAKARLAALIGMRAQYAKDTDFAAASANYHRALELYDEVGDHGSQEYLEFAHNFASALADHGRCADALPIVDKVITAMEASSPGKLHMPLILRGQCLRETGDRAGAVESYQRAYDQCKQDRCELAGSFLSAWGLGQLLVDTDRAKARGLVEDARKILVDAGVKDGDHDLEMLDTWLKKH